MGKNQTGVVVRFPVLGTPKRPTVKFKRGDRVKLARDAMRRPPRPAEAGTGKVVEVGTSRFVRVRFSRSGPGSWFAPRLLEHA